MKKKFKQSAPDRGEPTTPPAPAWMRVFVWSVLGCAGLFGVWAAVLSANRVVEVNQFTTQGWGQYAEVIVANKIGALWHVAFMTLCAGGALWWMVVKKIEGGRWTVDGGRAKSGGQRAAEPGSSEVRGLWSAVGGPGSLVPWLLVLLVVGDAWLLSRHYVKTMPMSALDANPVISILKKDMPERRVALVSQDGFYNFWLTILFPFHDIKAVNITQMPRMPIDYKNYLGAMSRNPVRMWQLAAVGYVLAPVQTWTQIQKDPSWNDAFDLMYSYNVGPAEVGVTVVPATPQYPGQHVVLRLKKPAPRFALIGQCETVEDEEALSLLASPKYPLFEKVLVAKPEKGLRESGGGQEWGTLTNAGMVGTCSLTQYRPGCVDLDVKADHPAILRVSEKYDKDWRAIVDGQPVPIHRVDYIFQGILVPKGAHHVVLEYAPPVWPLGVQAVGIVLSLGSVVWLVVTNWLRKAVVNNTHHPASNAGQNRVQV